MFVCLFWARHRISHPKALKHIRNQSIEFTENFKILSNPQLQIPISIYTFKRDIVLNLLIRVNEADLRLFKDRKGPGLALSPSLLPCCLIHVT